MVVGPQTYHRLPELVGQADPAARKRVVDTDFPAEVKFDFLQRTVSRGPAAFLSVQEGCTNFAASALCLIQEALNILDSSVCLGEARRLVANGTVELTAWSKRKCVSREMDTGDTCLVALFVNLLRLMV